LFYTEFYVLLYCCKLKNSERREREAAEFMIIKQKQQHDYELKMKQIEVLHYHVVDKLNDGVQV